MKSLMVVVCLALVFLSATLSTNAQVSGPLTGVHLGNLVETPRGLRPLDLEGFSEDLNEDGFVDPLVPVAQPTVAAAAAVPIPTAAAHVVSPVVTPAAAYAPAVVPHPFTAAYPYVSSPVAHPQSPFVFAHGAYPFHPQSYVPQLALHTPHHVPHFGYGFEGGVNHRGLVF